MTQTATQFKEVSPEMLGNPYIKVSLGRGIFFLPGVPKVKTLGWEQPMESRDSGHTWHWISGAHLLEYWSFASPVAEGLLGTFT